MNASLFPDMLVRQDTSPQADLSIENGQVLRYVWESKFGPMLIEVKGGCAYVDGQPVAPAEAESASLPST